MEFQRPRLPLLTTIPAEPQARPACGYRAAQREALARQVVAPVHWWQALSEAQRPPYAATVLLELGPGNTLQTLARGLPRLRALGVSGAGEAAAVVAHVCRQG